MQAFSVDLWFRQKWSTWNFCLWPLGATNSPSQLTGKRKKLEAVDSVFNKFDDEETEEQPRKRKLVPLDYEEDSNKRPDGAENSASKSSINTEEKRKHIVKLIEKIPTGRAELFSYPLDWSMVDSVGIYWR